MTPATGGFRSGRDAPSAGDVRRQNAAAYRPRVRRPPRLSRSRPTIAAPPPPSDDPAPPDRPEARSAAVGAAAWELLRDAPVAVLVADPDGMVVLATREAERRFGWEVGGLIGLPLATLIPDRFRGAHQSRWPEFFRNPRPLIYGADAGLSARRRDGGELPIELRLAPVEADGRTYVLAVIEDVAGQRDAAEAAREQEQTLRTFVDHSPAVVYLKTTEGRYLLVNRQFLTIFGLEWEQVVGREEEAIHPPQVAAAIRRNDREVIEGGEPVRFDETVEHAGGAHDYISVKFPLRNAAGEVWGLGGVSTDVTDRNRAAKAVAELNHLQDLILDSVGEGIYGLDTDGNVTFVNPAAAALLGWEADGLLGRDQHAVLRHTRPDGSPYPREDCPIYAVMRDGEARTVEDEVFWRKDGTSFPVSYQSRPLREGGAVTGAVVTFRDLTDELGREHDRRELRAARAVQEKLYPKDAPRVPGYEIAGAAYPAEDACGDYFDFVPLPDGRLAVAVGDVSGHGLGPALVMVAARAFLRAALLADPTPAAALTQMERQLAPDLPPSMFLTLLLGVLDPRAGTFEYVGAGHRGFHLPASGPPRTLDRTAAGVGMIPEPDAAAGRTARLRPGDLLLIPTDGLEETFSPDGEMFGVDRLLALAAGHRALPAREIAAELNDAARAHRGGGPQKDDVTLVLIKAL